MEVFMLFFHWNRLCRLNLLLDCSEAVLNYHRVCELARVCKMFHFNLFFLTFSTYIFMYMVRGLGEFIMMVLQEETLTLSGPFWCFCFLVGREWWFINWGYWSKGVIFKVGSLEGLGKGLQLWVLSLLNGFPVEGLWIPGGANWRLVQWSLLLNG